MVCRYSAIRSTEPLRARLTGLQPCLIPRRGYITRAREAHETDLQIEELEVRHPHARAWLTRNCPDWTVGPHYITRAREAQGRQPGVQN